MKKKIINAYLFSVDDWKHQITPIEKIRKDLDKYEKIGATHIEIDERAEYGDTYFYINVLQERLETDDECLERITEYEKAQAQIKAWDLTIFNEIKRKYNL
jgi:HD superfamily phosphodiesterase